MHAQIEHSYDDALAQAIVELTCLKRLHTGACEGTRGDLPLVPLR